MKKLLLQASLIVLAALVGWQTQPIPAVRAVEIQPGNPAETILSETIDRIPTSFITNNLSQQPESGLQTSGLSNAGLTQPYPANNLPALEAFIPQVIDGQAGSVRGLYIPGLIALRIVQQPDGQYDFISYEEDTATQFQSPSLFGVIGLLAHNFLSGRSFFQIVPGELLTIVYGDGQTEAFQVAEIHDYQRLAELDLHSDFQDLANNQTLSADQVFQYYYQGQRHLTLQTCLEKDGNWNWGIRMITALPVTAAP